MGVSKYQNFTARISPCSQGPTGHNIAFHAYLHTKKIIEICIVRPSVEAPLKVSLSVHYASGSSVIVQTNSSELAL